MIIDWSPSFESTTSLSSSPSLIVASILIVSFPFFADVITGAWGSIGNAEKQTLVREQHLTDFTVSPNSKRFYSPDKLIGFRSRRRLGETNANGIASSCDTDDCCDCRCPLSNGRQCIFAESAPPLLSAQQLLLLFLLMLLLTLESGGVVLPLRRRLPHRWALRRFAGVDGCTSLSSSSLEITTGIVSWWRLRNWLDRIIYTSRKLMKSDESFHRVVSTGLGVDWGIDCAFCKNRNEFGAALPDNVESLALNAG